MIRCAARYDGFEVLICRSSKLRFPAQAREMLDRL